MPMPYSVSALLRLSALMISLAIPPALHAQSTGADTRQKAWKKRKVSEQQDNEFVNFGQWKEVAQFIDDMVARNGFDRAALNKVFSQIQYTDTAIKLMKPAPPGRPKNWTAYRLRFVEPVRINGGVQFWNKYEGELARAEIEYGVPAEIIVAIIGVETVYGSNTGNFRVMDAITTLAFDYPDTPNREARMQFFRRELENTLLFARESNIDPFSLQGSYAGAIGLPQFMPGSIRQYAVDFDGDGKIDLRNSPVDAIGSVAHFLSMHGWRRGLPLVFPVNAPAANGAADGATSGADDGGAQPWQALIDKSLEATHSLDEMKAAGVAPSGAPAPADLQYGLIDLQNGVGPTEYWLGTDNFFAITKYNRSYFYAMSVIDLSQAIRAARAH
jgi:peptidoglycan lytic transglycosylase B